MRLKSLCLNLLLRPSCVFKKRRIKRVRTTKMAVLTEKGSKVQCYKWWFNLLRLRPNPPPHPVCNSGTCTSMASSQLKEGAGRWRSWQFPAHPAHSGCTQEVRQWSGRIICREGKGQGKFRAGRWWTGSLLEGGFQWQRHMLDSIPCFPPHTSLPLLEFRPAT